LYAVRARYVGAPATLGFIDPNVGGGEKKKTLDDCVGREREEKRRKFWMIVITWTNWKLIRKPLGTSWP
jgi:hypothetical protein